MIDPAGFPVYESSAAIKWLLDKRVEYDIGVEDVMEESFSLDTVGNVR